MWDGTATLHKTEQNSYVELAVFCYVAPKHMQQFWNDPVVQEKFRAAALSQSISSSVPEHAKGIQSYMYMII